MRRTPASLAFLVVSVSLLADCGDDPAPETADVSTDAETTGPSADTEPPDDTEPAEGTESTEAPEDDAQPRPATTSAGSGTATVEVGDQSFDFRVIQCLRDVPGLLGGVVTFQLDGVPPDAPQEVVEPLMGVADPDPDIFDRMGVALEYGPLLSVMRLEDGGDYVAVSLEDSEAHVSDGATSGDRYLDIGDEPGGAVVTGDTAVTAGDGSALPLTVMAACP